MVIILICILILPNNVLAESTIQRIDPSDNGYVGALNNRPSNSAPFRDVSVNISSFSPMYIVPVQGWWYEQNEPTTIKVLIRPNNDSSASSTTVKTVDFG